MNLFEARHLAHQLMREHGLADWTFAFDHARRRFGSCQYRVRRITLSRPLTLLNCLEQVRDTLLHEIAHALTPGDGHGSRWKAKCVEIGAEPRRCYTDERVASPPRSPAPYAIGCVRCNWWAERRRLTRRKLVCKQCRQPVVFRVRQEKAEGSRR
jgi:predicted SprT family Zn-dependent metalloprotease